MLGEMMSDQKYCDDGLCHFFWEKEDPLMSEEAGNYYKGPDVKKYIRNMVTQCLARKKGTDDYYLMKTLIISDGNNNLHERGAFHTEYKILSLLKGHPGVVQLHDFFTDSILLGEPDDIFREEVKRFFMVLECLIPHGGRNPQLIPLHKYITEKKKLTEFEALHILINILIVVEDLHKKNIVHKDLKLSNVILDRTTMRIKLINFYYAKKISSDNETCYVQRGNPSYLAPEAFLGKPVSPKPCDMRSIGIILYALLHGYLPLMGGAGFSYSSMTNPRALAHMYSKIITNEYLISESLNVSETTKLLIRGLLCKDPPLRLRATEAVDMAASIIASQSYRRKILSTNSCCNQIVPENPNFEEEEQSSSPCPVKAEDEERKAPETEDSRKVR